jgi:hypothetical protein
LRKKNRNHFPIPGFFYQLAVQSLNDCKFVFSVLPAKILEIWGLVMYRWKGLENTFPTLYYMPKKIQFIVAKEKEKCSCFGIVFY